MLGGRDLPLPPHMRPSLDIGSDVSQSFRGEGGGAFWSINHRNNGEEEEAGLLALAGEE